MKPDSILKTIVNAVKAKEELQGVVCKYADSRDFAQNPVCNFTLCLGVGKVRFVKDADSASPEFSTDFNLCLLAPSGAGGKRLSEMSQWVGEAIRESVSVSSLEIGAAEFNDTSATLYSDITVTVEDTSLADAECDLLISGVRIEDLISFEIESSEETEKCGQLLNGYSFEETGTAQYLISLKTSGPLFRRGSGFTVQIDYESTREVFRGCKINKAKRELNKLGNVSFSYEITAESYEFSEKEVQSE